ncbi:MAG: hypothetical protein AAEJ52_02815 [Myxococcota bacterium]
MAVGSAGERRTPPHAMLRCTELGPLRGSRWATLAIALWAALQTLLRVPDPATLLFTRQDVAYQLTGAMQVLFGEHPFVDFRSVYGPLVFYASALGQWIGAERAVAEFVLQALAFALAYALLFRLTWAASGRFGIAFGSTLFAVTLMPRIWSYYLVLGPMLTLYTAWRYVERPGRSSLALLAVAVAVAGLFRADFGVYCALGAFIAVGTRPAPSTAVRLRRVASLALAVFLCATPWLVFVAIRGGLSDYLFDSIGASAVVARVFALPFPGFNPHLIPFYRAENALPILFPLVNLVPSAALGVLIATRGRFAAEQRAQLFCALAIAQGTLVQSLHRSDYWHLLQAIPASFVLWAWLAGLAFPAGALGNRPTRAGFSRMLAAAGLVVLYGTLATHDWPGLDVVSKWRHLRLHSSSRAEVLVHAEREDLRRGPVDLVLYVRECVEPSQRILALPRLMSIYYTSGRPFGGGQMLVAPGYFTAPEDQQRMVESLQSDGTVLLIDIPHYRYDGRDENRTDLYAPIVADYLRESFVPVRRFGEAVVGVHRDRLDAFSRVHAGNRRCLGRLWERRAKR